MNRIILIGNGFDLAHGLKTNYADFIDWYWWEWGKLLLNSIHRIEKDRFCTFKLRDNDKLLYWSYVWDSYHPIRHYIKPGEEQELTKKAKQDRGLCDYFITSPLFKKICNEVDKPWFSIEDIYYAFLKTSDNPELINDDLEFIKNKLIEYLKSLDKPSINPVIRKQILAPLSKEEIAIKSMDQWKEVMKERLEYNDIKWKNLIDGYYTDYGALRSAESSVEHFISEFAADIRSDKFDDVMEEICPAFRLPDNIMLLDFNYTNTTDLYRPDADKFSVNHIHGRLSDPQSVIFGYGDEKDDEYEKLMRKKDNEYLRHIKSFRYLDASNYRRMLAFIESDSYQICIMGHSCGVTDRTLLSTLFEHPNCVSIKPYYYQKDDGTDNYRELVQNIARNFSDPHLMRDRVVGKERCQALGKE